MRSTSVARVAILSAAGIVAASIPMVSSAQSPDTTPRPPGEWFFAIEPGMCFDDVWTDDGSFDFATLPAEVDCAEPHDNEVVAIVTMGGDEPFPEGDLEPFVVELCEPEYEAFLGRPSADAVMTTAAYWPDANDWAAGATDAICTVYTGGKKVGTARSGSLRAPGERIAVYREVDGDPDIWLVDAGTGAMVQNISNIDLTEQVDVPSWRPDGLAVAFAAQTAPGNADIFEVTLADGSMERLVAMDGEQNGPAYSPDGRTIAFISRTETTEYDIYTQDLETGEVTQLTTHPDRDSNPEWSPDGEFLAFRRQIDGTNDLWVMRADGSDPVQLTADAGDNFDPRWSPHGSSILFTSNRAGNYDIWVMDADGGDPRPLTTHPADDEYPAWSSDGEFIAFQSSRYLGQTLWLMRADGSEATELTGVGPVGWPRFAP